MARREIQRQTVLVGGKVRHMRKQRRLTQCELAQRIGVQQSDLCRMENGEYKISLDTLFRILAVFGMDIGEFFQDEFPPPTPTAQDREALRLLRRLNAGERAEVLEFIRYKLEHRSATWNDS